MKDVLDETGERDVTILGAIAMLTDANLRLKWHCMSFV